MQQRSRSGTPVLMHLRQLSPLSHASSSPGYSEGPSTPSGAPGEEHTYVERFAELLQAATAATVQAGLFLQGACSGGWPVHALSAPAVHVRVWAFCLCASRIASGKMLHALVLPHTNGTCCATHLFQGREHEQVAAASTLQAVLPLLAAPCCSSLQREPLPWCPPSTTQQALCTARALPSLGAGSQPA